MRDAASTAARGAPRTGWLNRTVLGIGLASLFSDWSHEIATTVLPLFLGTIGASAAWLGAIEGISDGVASFAKMASGYWADRLRKRKGIAIAGYVMTAAGTASIGLAMTASQVLAARAFAWLGRGIRTPVRKALLASVVTPQTYGRAFGFERMMDTLGAILGPATAWLLLDRWHPGYANLFALTLVPGLIAVVAMALIVRERARPRVERVSFRNSVKALPRQFRRFAAAVGLFGLGDFAHTLLILLAMQSLTPRFGAAQATAVAAGLYVLHNVLYAGCSMGAGWLADRFDKGRLLSLGYLLAAIATLLIVVLPLDVWALAVVFALAGVSVAIVETLEDSFCAELVVESSHGMAFATVATINGVGDFVSSTALGLLWTAFGHALAFAFSAALLLAGAATMWFVAGLRDPDAVATRLHDARR